MMEAEQFEDLCRSNRRAILAYAYTCCRDLNLAEDIVQDAMLVAFQKKDSYFPEASFCGWLIAITRNVWMRYRSKLNTTVSTNEAIENAASILFDQSRYEDDAWLHKQEILQSCLGKLQSVDQKIIGSHFQQNKRYKEIAHDMGKTLTWVANRMCRARMALLDCMKRAMRMEEVLL